MQNNIINKSIRGGLIATTAMTIVMLMAPLMGMPNMLIGIMLAHFMIGSFIALGYVLSVEKLPGNRVLKGMLYSLLPFLIAQSVVMPVMGAGFLFCPYGSAHDYDNGQFNRASGVRSGFGICR